MNSLLRILLSTASAAFLILVGFSLGLAHAPRTLPDQITVHTAKENPSAIVLEVSEAREVLAQVSPRHRLAKVYEEEAFGATSDSEDLRVE